MCFTVSRVHASLFDEAARWPWAGLNWDRRKKPKGHIHIGMDDGMARQCLRVKRRNRLVVEFRSEMVHAAQRRARPEHALAVPLFTFLSQVARHTIRTRKIDRWDGIVQVLHAFPADLYGYKRPSTCIGRSARRKRTIDVSMSLWPRSQT